MNKDKVFIFLENYDNSDHIAQYGVRLAKAIQKPALLYSTIKADYSYIPTPITGTGIAYPKRMRIEEMRKEAAPYFEKIIDSVKGFWTDVSFDIEIGFPEEKTIESLEEYNAKILVLEGKNDLSNLNEWFGTFETRLAEQSSCPSLVVPPKYFWQPINKILYVMDSSDTKVKNLSILTQMANQLDAHLQVVLVNDQIKAANLNVQSIIETFKGFTNNDNLTFHRVYGKEPAKEMKRIVQETRPDWLAFEQKNKSFFERILGNYNTKRLILQSEIPCFVF